jgi:transposase-like protein
MKTPADEKRAPVRRFIHLGDRLVAIDRVRAGQASVEEVARELDVRAAEVRHWIEVHGRERTVSLAELRGGGSPEKQKLSRRAARLARLIAQAERLLHELHNEFISKQVGENHHLRTLRVVHAQPNVE